MGHPNDNECTYDKKIPAYWGFSVFGFIVNPLLGSFALLFSYETVRCQKRGWNHARIYSDVSFGLSIVSIFISILVVLLVYSFGHFPEHTYFDRNDIIGSAIEEGEKGGVTEVVNATVGQLATTLLPAMTSSN